MCIYIYIYIERERERERERELYIFLVMKSFKVMTHDVNTYYIERLTNTLKKKKKKRT